jgi:hypothetical protein
MENNKIPQEIENIIINEVIRDERNLGQYARNEIPLSEFIKEAYDKGFQAGQKQSEDAFKEMIENRIDIIKREAKTDREWIDNNITQAKLEELKELLSKIGDNSDNSQTELRAPKKVCSSDKEVAQPYSKSDKTTKEVTSND